MHKHGLSLLLVVTASMAGGAAPAHGTGHEAQAHMDSREQQHRHKEDHAGQLGVVVEVKEGVARWLARSLQANLQAKVGEAVEERKRRAVLAPVLRHQPHA